ncbi:doublesex- and mab-3-related transcription factor 1Y-like [Erpetoichthys calabaricus]|uniref:doublesex- and mab-3-related transcription factor 1Y-like n=1 Tax=Erpetoichthys calabaricus TaxID=27687 RepID=UPI002233EE73|nr:doublesex- and mab-3-related transcription factor 1Y-like [Erpetoichthys calabaricus]
MPGMSKPQWSPEGPSFGSDTKMLPRRPKCVRCRNHDLLVPIKGHARKCPFYLCQCWKCALNSERTRIATIQRSLKRKQQAEQPLERAARLHNSGTFGGFPDVDCMSISSDPKHRPTILDSGGGKVDTGKQPGASSLLLGFSDREPAKVLYMQYPCLQAYNVCHAPTWNISGRPPFLEELTVPLSLPSFQGHVLPNSTYLTQVSKLVLMAGCNFSPSCCSAKAVRVYGEDLVIINQELPHFFHLIEYFEKGGLGGWKINT